jgi:tetraacyldisaccharide 4'-kinase
LIRALKPLGGLYGRVMNARNAMYDRGSFRAHSLGARTISVGNITTGGTGKTPVVAMVAELLAEAGEKPCILTRGYGRRDAGKRVLVSDGITVLSDAATGGDEPVELAQMLLGRAAVVADADRVAAAEWVLAHLGVTAFVLDDGFQHRRAARDIDIVCIDATDPFGGGELLPAGRLREPLEGLKRADAIIITRADLAETAETENRIREVASDVKIFKAANSIAGFTRIDGSVFPMPTNAFAFCGLGNPGQFEQQLENRGLVLKGVRTFPDHHRYRQIDIDEIERAAKDAGAESLITTGKDAVKLDGLQFSMPCCIARIKIELDDREDFRRLVTASS